MTQFFAVIAGAFILLCVLNWLLPGNVIFWLSVAWLVYVAVGAIVRRVRR